jgi:hypothetical protein
MQVKLEKLVIEGTLDEIRACLADLGYGGSDINGGQPVARDNAEAQVAKLKRVLDQRKSPMSDDMVALLRTLYAARDKPLTGMQLATKLKLRKGINELNGLLGSLGRRISTTTGESPPAGHIALELLCTIEKTQKGKPGYSYGPLEPAARRALEELSLVQG